MHFSVQLALNKYYAIFFLRYFNLMSLLTSDLHVV